MNTIYVYSEIIAFELWCAHFLQKENALKTRHIITCPLGCVNMCEIERNKYLWFLGSYRDFFWFSYTLKKRRFCCFQILFKSLKRILFTNNIIGLGHNTNIGQVKTWQLKCSLRTLGTQRKNQGPVWFVSYLGFYIFSFYFIWNFYFHNLRELT